MTSINIGLKCDPQVELSSVAEICNYIMEGGGLVFGRGKKGGGLVERRLLICSFIRYSLPRSAMYSIAIGKPTERQRHTFCTRPSTPYKPQQLLSLVFRPPPPIPSSSRRGKPRPLNAAQAFVLHQRLLPHMWWGVVMTIVAMALVSITNFVGPEGVQPDGASNPALGAVFILMSCVVQVSHSCCCCGVTR